MIARKITSVVKMMTEVLLVASPDTIAGKCEQLKDNQSQSLASIATTTNLTVIAYEATTFVELLFRSHIWEKLTPMQRLIISSGIIIGALTSASSSFSALEKNIAESGFMASTSAFAFFATRKYLAHCIANQNQAGQQAPTRPN